MKRSFSFMMAEAYGDDVVVTHSSSLSARQWGSSARPACVGLLVIAAETAIHDLPQGDFDLTHFPGSFRYILSLFLGASTFSKF